MTETYLITFKPVGRFYFGTSRSFADDFFARSSRFPTQTTILGTLRYNLLKARNLLDNLLRYPREINDEVKNLTGESEMKNISDEINSKNYFGIIKKISPVFICHQPNDLLFPHNFYFPVPYDVIYVRDKDGSKTIIGIEQIRFSRNMDNNNLITSVVIKTKEQPAELLGGNIFWDSYLNKKHLSLVNTLKYNDVFIEDSQPGIERGIGLESNRKTLNEKYYIKKDFRMQKDFSFGVIVHFKEAPPIESEDVFLGGERSLFRMMLTKIDNNNIGIPNDHMIMRKIIDENNFGDFDGSVKTSFSNDEAIIFLSPFFGEGYLKGVEHSVIEEMYSPRMLSRYNIKTNTFNVIPSRSVIYPSNELLINKVFAIPKIIGYNFALKFKYEVKDEPL
ncbi:MAG: type III-B CRISPR module-associated Cmr3 family protein [Ignavibacteriaceae bacterium]